MVYFGSQIALYQYACPLIHYNKKSQQGNSWYNME